MRKFIKSLISFTSNFKTNSKIFIFEVMKNNSNKITLIYVLILMFVAFIGHQFFLDYTKNSENISSYLYIRDFIFIFISGIILKFILLHNEKNNKSVFEKLQITNNEILESNERYDIVAKATSDTIWDWKIEDDSFLWNKGIQGVFGYKKEEVGKTSKWWFERIHPEDSLKMSVKLYSFLEQKTEKWQDEYRFQCADGSYKYVFDRGFLVKDKDGKPIRMIGAIQDVTKQKEEEQRLRLLETVITQTKDAVMITDIDTTQNVIPNIIFVNSAFTDMTGYTAEEVIGKSPIMFIGAKSDMLEFDKLKTAIQEYRECFVETINYKKNGEEFWNNFSMIPVTDKDGEHSHWISIQRDVTEEKNKEKEREQLIRELTQNNKDLKQFSYITSHNLRAPLSNLTGLLNLVEDMDIEDPELKEIITGFTKSTHLLNETINDLVKVVIIKDNPSIHKEKVLIKEIFENVFNQLSFLIGLHKPILKIDLEEVSILNINKSYLESIFLNLLTNAIKYRSENRQLKVNISSKVEDDNLVLTFKDNGVGIDLVRNRDKIFGLYQRFHNHPDSKGLGLYLVKSQVEAMGGTINVESTVGKGTTFTIIFKNN
ncbi:MAG: Adaptive-response sensory-kinase SasA [Bacteroidota bacterium]